MSTTDQLTADGAFVISRVFDAPRELVWKAWTEPERMQRWWGPKGVVVAVSNLDFRPGGIHHYCMRTPDGHTMWGKMVYREIEAPARFVFVNAFSDENGGLTRHPMSPNWPIEVLSTVSLEESAEGTKVTIRWTPINPTEIEKQTFDSGHPSMQQGWTGTLDQLAAYLAEAQK